MQARATEQLDALLVPFVRTPDGAEGERLLAVLIEEHAAPVVAKIVGYKLHTSPRARYDEAVSEAEDIRSTVMLQLVGRLRTLRDDHALRPITDFAAYVAVATYNAYDRYISNKYPQRRRLKNGLRYLLTHRSGLALWQAADGGWVGGLHGWRLQMFDDTGGGGKRGAHDKGYYNALDADKTRRLQLLRDDAFVFAERGSDAANRNLREPRQADALLNQIFAWVGAPVELDLLVSIIAEWWGITDETIEIGDGGARDEGDNRGARTHGAQLADPRPDAAIETERRVYLTRLWDEIKELPPRQCAALLLNLRDEGGRGVIDVWTLTGIADIETIAAALGVSPDGLAALWNDLPLDDNRIAAHLGLTRQQIINLRKSARERLARRMKNF